MPIRMQHAEHGYHHAYSDEEIKTLESSGWVIEGCKLKPLLADKQVAPMQSDQPSFGNAIPKKRGRSAKAK